MRSDPKGPIAIVGVLVDPNLVVKQLFGQDRRLRGSRQVDLSGLEQDLEARDEIGLAEVLST